MRSLLIYSFTVGLLTFTALTLLDGFSLAQHSPGRAAIVGAICSGIAYLLVHKLSSKATRNRDGVQD